MYAYFAMLHKRFTHACSYRSDGTIRVFTNCAERMADDETLKAYEEQLSSSTIAAQIGDLKTEELPPASFLLNPG